MNQRSLTAPRRSLGAVLLLTPALIWLAAFFLVPTVIVVATSFFEYHDNQIVPTFTLENYREFLTDGYNIRVFFKTVQIAVGVSVVGIVLAYPIAYFLVRSRSRVRGLVLVFVLMPLLASVVVRTYGWLVLLQDQGLVNQVLETLGFGPLELMHTYTAVFLGLLHVLLPYSILSIMAGLHSVHPSLERAASDLGAGRLQTFRFVTLPLIWPGIFTGFVLTFALAFTAYATPRVLGGTRKPVSATVIYDYMLFLLDWPMASAMAVFVLIVTSLLLYVLARIQRRG